jgi:hypothetical protein
MFDSFERRPRRAGGDFTLRRCHRRHAQLSSNNTYADIAATQPARRVAASPHYQLQPWSTALISPIALC